MGEKPSSFQVFWRNLWKFWEYSVFLAFSPTLNANFPAVKEHINHESIKQFNGHPSRILNGYKK